MDSTTSTNSNGRRVFLAEPVHKFSPEAAKEFGEIVILSQERINPFDIENTVRTLRAALEEHKFDQKKDSIAVTGQASCVILCMIVQEYWSDPLVRILLFDARFNNYKPREVSLRESE